MSYPGKVFRIISQCVGDAPRIQEGKDSSEQPENDREFIKPFLSTRVRRMLIRRRVGEEAVFLTLITSGRSLGRYVEESG